MAVKLKVCGVTSLEDACAAVDCGAEYLGFNFYPKSPRYIAPPAARAVIERLPDDIISVGVFVNEPRPEDVDEILRASGARMAQLHGDESPDYCASVGADRVIKALRISENFDARRVLDYPASAILLDAYDAKLYGGTGRTANWTIAREAARLTRVFLAGGLSPENIVEAIRAVEPFAVDVNSGVESAPGRKDATKLQTLRNRMKGECGQ
ncbi:MAG TPA: phosphoribosylanthranilate isomerase [Blastocatellia bacterium]|jgi:phosphoribosylanthranilate isomerase|nr:phosphoribosylanthranilate isomerase [Blastocatellia bacterium]